ncbi:MAG: hypothetical protein ACM3XM_19970 [Mycobacterium leprae]
MVRIRLASLLLGLLLITTTGCADPLPPVPPSPQPAPSPTPRPSDREALAFVEAFMQARMAGATSAVQAMLDRSLAGRAGTFALKSGERITAYLVEALPNDNEAFFRYQIRVAVSIDASRSRVATERLTVAWRGGFKAADWVDVPTQMLTLSEGKDRKLYLYRGQDLAEVADRDVLPKAYRPFGAGAGIAFATGREGWLVAAPSLTGSHVLWVTRGNHPLLGFSQVNWGGAPIQASLDLLFEGGATEAAWAPGTAQHVAVAVAVPSGSTLLYIWDVTTKTRFGPDLTKELGPDVTVKGIRWPCAVRKIVAFDILQGGRQSGPWLYDLEQGLEQKRLVGPQGSDLSAICAQSVVPAQP